MGGGQINGQWGGTGIAHLYVCLLGGVFYSLSRLKLFFFLFHPFSGIGFLLLKLKWTFKTNVLLFYEFYLPKQFRKFKFSDGGFGKKKKPVFWKVLGNFLQAGPEDLKNPLKRAFHFLF